LVIASVIYDLEAMTYLVAYLPRQTRPYLGTNVNGMVVNLEKC
jgi:hypothetical protein